MQAPAVPVPQVNTQTARALSAQPVQPVRTDPVFAERCAEAVTVVVPAALEVAAAVDPPLDERPRRPVDQLTVSHLDISPRFSPAISPAISTGVSPAAAAPLLNPRMSFHSSSPDFF